MPLPPPGQMGIIRAIRMPEERSGRVIAIEDVQSRLNQLRQGLVEMRGYL